jgi:hypothetical protein
MTDRISVEDLTEALERVQRQMAWVKGKLASDNIQSIDASDRVILTAARLLVDNPAVLEALQDGSVVNQEPIRWCLEHDGTTEGGTKCDARRAWGYTSDCGLLDAVVITRGQETR